MILKMGIVDDNSYSILMHEDICIIIFTQLWIVLREFEYSEKSCSG